MKSFDGDEAQQAEALNARQTGRLSTAGVKRALMPQPPQRALSAGRWLSTAAPRSAAGSARSVQPRYSRRSNWRCRRSHKPKPRSSPPVAPIPGVHASLQVVHFDTTAVREPTAWVRGGNQFLPDDVAIRWAAPVDEQFHARFCGPFTTLCLSADLSAAAPGLHAMHRLDALAAFDLARIRRRCPRCGARTTSPAFAPPECQAKSPVKTIHFGRRAAAWCG